VGGDEGEGGPKGLHLVHPSPSQRLSLRGMSPSGAEPEPAATLALPHRRGRGLLGRFEISFVNLYRPYNSGLISK